METIIYSLGLPGIDKAKVVKKLDHTSLSEVKNILKELQYGYVEPGDKIYFKQQFTKLKVKGNLRNTTILEIHSENCDYYYAAIMIS